MASNVEIRRWVKDHATHRYFMTKSGLPYPKPVHYRKDGAVRPAFAKYALMVAYAGSRIGDLNRLCEELRPHLQRRDFSESPLRAPLQQAIGKLAKRATVDEVLEVLAKTPGHYLDEASMEVGWCFQRGWVRIEPAAK